MSADGVKTRKPMRHKALHKERLDRVERHTPRPTVAGPDATVSTINEPPVVAIGDLGPVVHRSDLGHPPTLSVPLEVNEPATVTIQILKRDQVVREATVTQSSAGAFEGTISLRRIRGNVTLRVVAIDPEGAVSAPVDVILSVRR